MNDYLNEQILSLDRSLLVQLLEGLTNHVLIVVVIGAVQGPEKS